jgi:hypothetical protein
MCNNKFLQLNFENEFSYSLAVCFTYTVFYFLELAEV